MTMIVINPVNDIHCQYMLAYLRRNRIDHIELGSPMEHDYALHNDVLLYDGQPIKEVRAVFFRGVLSSQADPLQHEDAVKRFTDQAQFSARIEVVQSWLHLLADYGVRILQPPGFRAKFSQLNKLHRARLPMPRTCITSSPEIALSFIDSVGEAVCKPVRGGSYCRYVDQDVKAHLARITAEPVIFQEKIEGEDIRVNMLDGQLLSAHVIKTSSPDVLDYRTDPAYDAGTAEYELIELPQAVINDCQLAMETLGLRFSGIDLKYHQGRYVFIECNSMPAYMDIELKTGAPITHHLVQYMTEGLRVSLGSSESANYTHIYRPKEEFSRGDSLFDYYDVRAKWRDQMQRLHNRKFLELNEAQCQELRTKAGVDAEFVEVEIRDGQAEVIRFI